MFGKKEFRSPKRENINFNMTLVYSFTIPYFFTHCSLLIRAKHGFVVYNTLLYFAFTLCNKVSLKERNGLLLNDWCLLKTKIKFVVNETVKTFVKCVIKDVMAMTKD